MVRKIYRLTETDEVTIIDPTGPMPPQTVSAVEHLRWLAETIPQAVIVFPSPEDGVMDLWELRYDEKHAFEAALRDIHLLEPFRLT